MADQNNSKGEILKPLAAAVVGAAVGAAAVALSDPDNRKKLGKKAQELQKTGGEKLKDLDKATQSLRSQARGALQKGLSKASKKLGEEAKSLEDPKEKK